MFSYTNFNLKSKKFKLDLQSYDYVLECSNFLNNNPQDNISVPIAADLNQTRVIVALQNGFLKVLNSIDLELVYTSKVFKTSSGINDLKARPNLENQFLICSNDSQLILSDLETRQKLINFNRPSRSSFTNLEFFDKNIFSSANLDHQILLFDIRLDSKKPVQLINTNHHRGNGFSKRITGLVFSYLRYLYSSSDKYIKIFDLRFNNDSNNNQNKSNRLNYLNRLKYSGIKDESFTSLAMDDHLNLYASCTDNKIYSYNHQALIGNQFNLDSIKCFEGVSVTNFTRIKVLNNSNLSSSILISGSSDAEVVVWNLEDSKNRFVNYPALVLPHMLEEVGVVLVDNSKHEIFSLDDANNIYKWILNSKLNNQVKMYKKGKISECYNKKELKRFNLNTDNMDSRSPSPEKRINRKRFLSATNSNIEKEKQSFIKKPFKRSASVIESLNV